MSSQGSLIAAPLILLHDGGKTLFFQRAANLHVSVLDSFQPSSRRWRSPSETPVRRTSGGIIPFLDRPFFVVVHAPDYQTKTLLLIPQTFSIIT
jgi:hypothetical protein